MAFSRGPKIVTDGLVLYLDAVNTNSYPGSGNTWSDLSSNGNDGTLVNGPQFNSDNLGSIDFDGVNDNISIGNLSNNIPKTEGTLSAWVSPIGYESTQIYRIMNINVEGSTHGHGFDFSLYTNNRFLSVINAGSNRIFAYTPGLDNNFINSGIPKNLAYIWNETNQNWFINGESIGVGSNSFTENITPIDYSSETLQIGIRGSGGPFKGLIPQVSIYNKALSAEEILQNYNATKSRYGL